MTRAKRLQWGSLAFGVLLSGALYADDAKDIDRTPKSCIMVNSVARHEAANERTIVFFMRGSNKQIFRNDMPAACAFMKHGDTDLDYHYNTVSAKITRLCDYDGITVHNANQITCPLGKFTPITADEASTLLGRPIGSGDTTASQPAKNTGAAGQTKKK